MDWQSKTVGHIYPDDKVTRKGNYFQDVLQIRKKQQKEKNYNMRYRDNRREEQPGVSKELRVTITQQKHIPTKNTIITSYLRWREPLRPDQMAVQSRKKSGKR